MKNHVMYVLLSFVLSVVLSFLLFAHVFDSVFFLAFYMSVLSFLSCMSAFLRICRWFVFLSFVNVFVYFFLESLHSGLSFCLLTLLMSFFLCFRLPFFRCSLSGLCVPSF